MCEKRCYFFLNFPKNIFISLKFQKKGVISFSLLKKKLFLLISEKDK
jgi:hypothetical protein